MNGFEKTKMRGEVQIGLLPVHGAPPVEWLESADPLDYQTALAVMTERATAIARGEARELVWLLEHPALYTAGTSSRPHELIDARFPIYQTGRGGQFTYHGPGQRVAYLMLDLKRRAPDVRRFVATVEEWMIRTLAIIGVAAERRDDRVGVWVRQRRSDGDTEDKIAAIGVRVRHWVTLHGVALNIAPELSHFSGIVPCGISNPRYGITSLAALGISASMTAVDEILRREFEPLFGDTVDAQPLSSTENNSPARRNSKSRSPASV
jgi:lipoyl(octanoyl) transferase